LVGLKAASGNGERLKLGETIDIGFLGQTGDIVKGGGSTQALDRAAGTLAQFPLEGLHLEPKRLIFLLEALGPLFLLKEEFFFDAAAAQEQYR
jgi:hypothetical protein